MADIVRAAMAHVDHAGPPSAAQLEHAVDLAGRLQAPLPDIARGNAAACLLWIIAARARCRVS
jgi:hypothetical protein